MKTRIAFLLIVELLVGVAVLSISHAHRPATARALAEWRMQPTAENRAALDQQLKIQHRADEVDNLILWLGFSAFAAPVILLFPFRKTSSTARLAANL